jgi:hypothetical protein
MPKPSTNGLKLAQLEKMKAAYKANPSGGNNKHHHSMPLTDYSLIPLKNILSLLLANDIVKNDNRVEEVLKIDTYAVKAYFAQHVDAADCPENNEDYIGRNTVALVACRKGSNGWEDIIGDELDSDEDRIISAREACDKGRLCPPHCAL